MTTPVEFDANITINVFVGEGCGCAIGSSTN